MEQIFEALYHIFGRIYIPKECRLPGRKIVHLSDTPSMVYGSIMEAIKKIMPDYIIHTGDITDELKLEVMPHLVERYKIRANDFLRLLSENAKEKLIIVPGNHDKLEILNLGSNVEIFNEGDKVFIGDIIIGLSHNFNKLPKDCSFYMFGHDKSGTRMDKYLNGISFINVINIDEKKVTRLLYPLGTDDYRLKRGKISI